MSRLLGYSPPRMHCTPTPLNSAAPGKHDATVHSIESMHTGTRHELPASVVCDRCDATVPQYHGNGSLRSEGSELEIQHAGRQARLPPAGMCARDRSIGAAKAAAGSSVGYRACALDGAGCRYLPSHQPGVVCSAVSLARPPPTHKASKHSNQPNMDWWLLKDSVDLALTWEHPSPDRLKLNACLFFAAFLCSLGVGLSASLKVRFVNTGKQRTSIDLVSMRGRAAGSIGEAKRFLDRRSGAHHRSHLQHIGPGPHRLHSLLHPPHRRRLLLPDGPFVYVFVFVGGRRRSRLHSPLRMTGEATYSFKEPFQRYLSIHSTEQQPRAPDPVTQRFAPLCCVWAVTDMCFEEEETDIVSFSSGADG